MDVWAALRELWLEKQRLDRTIQILEAIERGEAPPGKPGRGRSSMPEEERKIVSERMKRYWARQRKLRAS
jgi:hypothetical protein